MATTATQPAINAAQPAINKDKYNRPDYFPIRTDSAFEADYGGLSMTLALLDGL